MPRRASQRDASNKPLFQAVCSRPNCEIQYAWEPSIHSAHHGVGRNYLMMCQRTMSTPFFDLSLISPYKKQNQQHFSAWDPACCDGLLSYGEDVTKHGLRLPVLRAFVILNRVEDVNAIMYDYRSLEMDWMQGMGIWLFPCDMSSIGVLKGVWRCWIFCW